MPVLRYSTTSTTAVALLALSLGFAPAQADPAAPFGAPQRPSPAGTGAIGLAASLSAIIEAELAAKEQAQTTANPFLKPRPRPNREHIAASNAAKPAGARTMAPATKG